MSIRLYGGGRSLLYTFRVLLGVSAEYDEGCGVTGEYRQMFSL
jgi:hypothetical protein